jgi:hypothetical protein
MMRWGSERGTARVFSRGKGGFWDFYGAGKAAGNKCPRENEKGLCRGLSPSLGGQCWLKEVILESNLVGLHQVGWEVAVDAWTKLQEDKC